MSAGRDTCTVSAVFTAVGIPRTRRWITQAARHCGLDDQRLPDFVLAVQELMTNAVRHGGGWGRVRLHRDGDTLVCAVTDHGPGFATDAVEPDAFPPGNSAGGRGLFLARRMTDSLTIGSGPAGAEVTVTMTLQRRRS